MEKSHHDPVYNVEWTAIGKTGSECVSSSTDGRVLWWDYKDPETNGEVPSPEQLIINEEVNGTKKVLGASSLSYNAEAGPLKYLIGTEQGLIVLANKRKTIDIQLRFGFDGGKHHGPVYALHRNPA